MLYLRAARTSLCAVLLVSLALSVPLSAATPAAARVITDADKGATVRIHLDGALELRLSSNPSTGYMWYIEKQSTPLLKLVKQGQTEAAEGGTGRPVFQIFWFSPRRLGAGKLMLHYVRSWEKPTPDDQRFEVQIVVE